MLARGGGGGEQLLQLQCHIPLDFPVIVVVRLQSHFYESSSFDDCKNSTHIVLGSPSLSRHICPSLSLSLSWLLLTLNRRSAGQNGWHRGPWRAKKVIKVNVLQ